ncbi:helix-turn-helix domain-containing protein [Streptococcus uberis]|uniref:helix-turn-helix domain-containing protein n=1 Tax=Streptococcus uberis TaxID=1349 RepID=UPI0012B5E3F3|nr:helix-turn-helix transcriptional regulator [Streptococcus uberis]MTB62534.1 helix-turn-helix domain-containing protein [Streptococcus uberis]MTB93408.1 helix-turn-helix domain-containing protein [Streptococcus uberis]MTC00098.1 helix-turn-helix domain-containing protein [Streptococcus uberis]
MIEYFGTNLSNLRKKNRLSQKELADELGLNKQSISEIENGRRFPTFTNLEKIAKFFNATPTQLFGSPSEIEFENTILRSEDYTEKMTELIRSVNQIENFLDKYDAKIDDLLYLTKGDVIYDVNGDECYFDPRFPNAGLTTSFEPGLELARSKSPLDMLIENADLL